MSRWTKNIVVPLESLCKEKESTNRPTVTRSVGTVGKWGKMGFTSTRTYALSGAVAAAAAAVSSSPSQSPASALDDDLSVSVPEPAKPKKFFKSRSVAPPEVIVQYIAQNLPRNTTSPIRESHPPSGLCTPSRETVKIKTPKSNSAERKKKSSKKLAKAIDNAVATDESHKFNEKLETDEKGVASTTATAKTISTTKSKKKKDEKKLKPEAAPSRIIPRARKAVNYCEDFEDDRVPTPIKDYVIPKSTDERAEESGSNARVDVELPPPASKTPEHPPIVLRISKGTSRLVSTDSEDIQNNESPHNRDAVEENPPSKIYPKATAKSHSPRPVVEEESLINNDEDSPEINYCTVKISPDKPPKERLKLIIKTDVIRNALAKAAAASAAKAALNAEKNNYNNANEGSEHRPEKEKKQKSKKHKHSKSSNPPPPPVVDTAALPEETVHTEFKTPSPHSALIPSEEPLQPEQIIHNSNIDEISLLQQPDLTQMTVSDRDFDSKCSLSDGFSSKGNETPQPATHIEENCTIRSPQPGVITSDLESSQHSSLAVAPSDIESRLEVMMMTLDGEASQKSVNLVEEQPLQEEDILAVLRGDDSEMGCLRDTLEAAQETPANHLSEEENEENINVNTEAEDQVEKEATGRVTRGRRRVVPKAQEPEKQSETLKTGAKTRTRKQAVPEETIAQKRARRTGKKDEEQIISNNNDLEEINEMENEPQTKDNMELNEANILKPVDQDDCIASRRSRSIRNANLIANFNNNNNNINKIAANLSAKAGAVEEAKVNVLTNSENNPLAPRTYGRKRKNQQVTQVIQPSAAELEQHLQPTPAKMPNIDLQESNMSITLPATVATSIRSDDVYTEKEEAATDESVRTFTTTTDISKSMPNRDYQIKDKFKRTLTLDPQANCNAIVETKANVVEETLDDEQRGAVKLVISKKKGSIFKSRTLVAASDQPDMTAAKRYLYKHRWDAEADADADANASNETEGKASPKVVNEKPNPPRTIAEEIFNDFNEDCQNGVEQNEPVVLSKFSRVTKPQPQSNSNNNEANEGENEGGVSSVKVDRKAKEFYMVVRNVKTAHQIQEIGEYQEMDDDVEYILDALQSQNPTPTRCLSALQLATKCMIPAFRMHVRAHGIVTKFFKALSDANTDLSLGLCTSAVMFILSQEGLNMDLDRDSLELMMNLLEAESVATTASDHATYERNKQKVRELCEEIKAQGKAAHLNVDTISVGTLAMETLLSLTSKRAGEWFKEELRELGGLEHIIKTVSDCCRPVFEHNSREIQISWTPSLLENLQTVDRCLRVLENVAEGNEENQRYMLTHAQGGAIKTLCSLYSMCERHIMLNPTNELTPKDDPGVIIRNLLISVLKVLVKLTHSFFDPSKAIGAEIIGKQKDILDTSYHLLLRTPNYIPERCVFELSILVLLLLMNLTIYTIPNRTRIMKSLIPAEYGNYQREKTAIEAIMEYFYKCEELARLVEKNTDAYLDNTDKAKKKQEEVDETVNNLLQKAGHHMEHTLKGSFAAIFIGQLMTDSDENEAIVRKFLRNDGFQEIIAVLEKYHNFMNLTASSEASTVAHIKETKKLIDYFKKREMVYEMNQSIDNTLPLNLEKNNGDESMSNAASGGGVVNGGTSANSSTSSAAGADSADDTYSGSHNDLGVRVYKTYSQR